jgi:hypothetical protein
MCSCGSHLTTTSGEGGWEWGGGGAEPHRHTSTVSLQSPGARIPPGTYKPNINSISKVKLRPFLRQKLLRLYLCRSSQ